MRSIRFKRASQSRNRGFTLPEIAAVMACIAILAAVLLPLFSGVRAKASREDANRNRAICSGNLKRLGLGLAQYVSDYDERYPPLTAGGVWGGWRQRIAPYVQNPKTFRCPSNPNNNWTAERASRKFPFYPGYTPRIPKSYSMNRNISRARDFSRINGPATRVMVTEARNDPRFNLDPMSPDWDRARGLVSWGFAGHLGTMNVLYADGHVKSLLPTKTAVPINQWGNGIGTGCVGKYARKNDPANWINCEQIEPDLLTGLNNLQQKYKEVFVDE